MTDITLQQAHDAVTAAINKAEQINTKMAIAVVGAGGHLKAFAQMDGAWLGAIDIALRKAKTSRLFDRDTGEIGKLSQPGGAALLHRALERRPDFVSRRNPTPQRGRRGDRGRRRIGKHGRRRPCGGRGRHRGGRMKRGELFKSKILHYRLHIAAILLC